MYDYLQFFKTSVSAVFNMNINTFIINLFNIYKNIDGSDKAR